MALSQLVRCANCVFCARFARVAVLRIGNDHRISVLGRTTADD